MTTVTTETTPDRGAQVADAARRQGELDEQRRRSSIAALSDPKIAAEVQDIESEMRSCERVIELGQLADVEQERLDAEARAEADEQVRAAALTEALALQDDCAVQAKKIDQSFAKACEAMCVYVEKRAALQRSIVAAGRGSSSFTAEARPYSIEASLVYAMREAGVSRDLLRGLPAISGEHLKPLAENEPKFVTDKE